MTYRLEIGRKAARQIRLCFDRLRRYSFPAAEKYERALEQAIDAYLIDPPFTFGYYWETGAPNRAFLFTVSPHTAYWVVYRTFEDEGIVRVVAFRSASAEPGTHGL